MSKRSNCRQSREYLVVGSGISWQGNLFKLVGCKAYWREWKWLRTRERRKAYCAWYGGVGEGVNVPRSLADVLPKF